MLQLLCSERVVSRVKTLNMNVINGLFSPFYLFSFHYFCDALDNDFIDDTWSSSSSWMYSSLESELGCNGGWLRQDRYVWAHWEGSVGLQCIWHRIKTLVRHACIPSKTYCSMAHTQRSRRGNAWWQKINFLIIRLKEIKKH